MQRKMLEDLGLSTDAIDKIMGESDADLEKQKEKHTLELDNATSQLETAQATLKEFEGIDVKDLQGKITALNAGLAKKDAEYNQKLADMEFDAALDNAITSTGAKNAKAVKALLDIDVLKTSKNQQEDIKNALEATKAENDYLFSSDEPIKNPVRDTGNTNIGTSNSLIRAAMGLPVETK